MLSWKTGGLLLGGVRATIQLETRLFKKDA